MSSSFDFSSQDSSRRSLCQHKGKCISHQAWRGKGLMASLPNGLCACVLCTGCVGNACTLDRDRFLNTLFRFNFILLTWTILFGKPFIKWRSGPAKEPAILCLCLNKHLLSWFKLFKARGLNAYAHLSLYIRCWTQQKKDFESARRHPFSCSLSRKHRGKLTEVMSRLWDPESTALLLGTLKPSRSHTWFLHVGTAGRKWHGLSVVLLSVWVKCVLTAGRPREIMSLHQHHPV